MKKQLALGFALTLAAIAIAWAQSYPSRAITVVVPFGAGGPADTIGRIVAEGMREPLGQPVIVENVVGASGTIGVGRVATAPADGYTSVLGNWATQGTTGAGGISTVGGLFFRRATGTQFRFVPYRGGLGPAMQDLLSGQIDFMIDTAANSLPQVRAGTIKAYALTAKTRLPAAPDIATVDEAGLPGLYALNWQAVFVPKGTPKDVVTRLNTAVMAALADATVRRRLADIGQEIFPREQQTPQALAAYQKAEIEKWWPIVKEANIKAE
jgi:tripartite-type tricarboxylate transporter receptor subunit TctC